MVWEYRMGQARRLSGVRKRGKEVAQRRFKDAVCRSVVVHRGRRLLQYGVRPPARDTSAASGRGGAADARSRRCSRSRGGGRERGRAGHLLASHVDAAEDMELGGDDAISAAVREEAGDVREADDTEVR